MSVNFASLLSKPIDSVKKPPSKPAGTYYATIKDYKFDVSKQKKTPYVRVNLQNVMPGEDIDQALLNDEEGKPIDFAKWTPYFDFYITDDSLFRLKDFIQSCKIETNGREFNETIPELKGKSVLLTAVQTPSNDGTSLYTNISEIKGAD